jgi:hypothetical protein
MCVNKTTNKFYIGYREQNVKLGIPSHIDFPEYKTSSKLVRPDFDNFTWFIVAEFFNGNDAYDFEQELINNHWDDPLLLNERCYYRKERFKGAPGRGGSPKGRKFSEKTLRKMSEAKKGILGRSHTEESKLKISNANKGKKMPPVSDETRQKLSDSHKGLIKSEEHRKNLSIANTGKSMSEEIRRKISKANKGKSSPHKGQKRPAQTEESNIKRSLALKGRHISEEQKIKISNSNKGRPSYNKGKPMSAEQKKKISETLRRKVLEKSLLK